MERPEKWVRIQFWEQGHFTGHMKWIVYQKNKSLGNKKNSEMYVVEINEYDGSSRETILSEGFDELIREGASIQIPLIGVRTGFGLDGTIYGIEVPTGVMGFGNYHIAWFMSGPSEWGQIIDWYYRVVQFLKEQLDTSEDI